MLERKRSPHFFPRDSAKASFAQLSKECKNVPLASAVRSDSRLEIPAEIYKKS
jgi:hypothetical protein